MQQCISPDFWQPILQQLLPPVAALLSAIALWVASRAHSTYKEEQRTLSSLVNSVQRSSGAPDDRGSRRTARARKK